MYLSLSKSMSSCRYRYYGILSPVRPSSTILLVPVFLPHTSWYKTPQENCRNTEEVVCWKQMWKKSIYNAHIIAEVQHFMQKFLYLISTVYPTSHIPSSFVLKLHYFFIILWKFNKHQQTWDMENNPWQVYKELSRQEPT